MSTILAEALKLSREERIRLAEAIWDSVAAEPDDASLTDAQRDELERRWLDDEASPDNVVPWESVRAEARARFRP